MITPKLNISDLNDICCLSMNSGAMYPLQEIIWFDSLRMKLIDSTYFTSRRWKRYWTYSVPKKKFSDHRALLFTDAPWHTKICDFWLHVGTQQHISRFEIQMIYAFLMNIMQTLADSLNYFITHIPFISMSFLCRSEHSKD